MQTATTTHLAGPGWTRPLPATLDSPQTLVLAFGASQLAVDAPALRALVDAFPQSVVLGCSTAGEIAGPEVNDGSLSVAGAGIAMLPTYFVGDELRRGALLQVLPGHEPEALGIHAVYLSRQHQPLPLRLLVDFLAERFGGDTAPWDRPMP
jgi:LysR substrate binding domain/FIST N domain